MILTFDIGNTNIVFALFDDNQLKHQWRVTSDISKSVDDYAVDLVEIFLTHKINCLNISGVIIGSVVPTLTRKIGEAVKKFTSTSIANKILTIGDGKTNIDIEVNVKNRSEVGHDRLINAYAASKKFGNNLIIVDFGTATTFDIVGESGEYLGGIIAPGINLSIKVLHEMTAQLPKISLKKQTAVIGKNTIEALNSGIYHGYISLIEGLITKIEKEYGAKTKHIFTGGLAEIFKDDLSNLIDHYEPNLTLEGMYKIYKKIN